MKKILLTIIVIFIATISIIAQENKEKERRKKFSIDEFQAQQKKFITEHAELTPEEAEKFFPVFFELQKEKWIIDKNARKKAGFKRGEKCSEEQCLQFVNELADAKVKTAELEKQYIEKYLNIIPACKILRVQHAEDRFQKHMLKNIWERRSQKETSVRNNR